MAVLLGLYILAVTAAPTVFQAHNPGAGLGPAIKMVGVERFELPALWSQTRCATRLRYTPTMLSYPHSGYFSSLLRMQNQFYFVFFLISGDALLASQRQQQLRIWLHVKFSGRPAI